MIENRHTQKRRVNIRGFIAELGCGGVQPPIPAPVEWSRLAASLPLMESMKVVDEVPDVFVWNAPVEPRDHRGSPRLITVKTSPSLDP
jgi:hypothetical protein